jgi:hypothetical protein
MLPNTATVENCTSNCNNQRPKLSVLSHTTNTPEPTDHSRPETSHTKESRHIISPTFPTAVSPTKINLTGDNSGRILCRKLTKIRSPNLLLLSTPVKQLPVPVAYCPCINANKGSLKFSRQEYSFMLDVNSLEDGCYNITINALT